MQTACGDELRGFKALIVDDLAVNREILEHQLSAWGMHCVCVDSAQKALHQLEQAILKTSPFDLVLLDRQMPHKDGLALARAIRARPDSQHLKLIMLSSLYTQTDHEDLAALGISAYLQKPIRQIELHRTLRALLTGDSELYIAQRQPPTVPAGGNLGHQCAVGRR